MYPISGIGEHGFALLPAVFSEGDLTMLVTALRDEKLHRSRAGVRHALHNPAVLNFAGDSRLVAIASAILGARAHPFRATFFDKSFASNWLVAWHQDTALPLQNRTDTPGWGPWSLKHGIYYAHAPAGVLERIVALRVHVDDSTSANGPLRVIAGSHRSGVLSDEEVWALAGKSTPIECTLAHGGVVAMLPLIVHASSKSLVARPRRVLHIEYAVSFAVGDGLELAIA